MAQNLDQDKLLTLYLLGELSEHEQRVLEEKYFVDDDYFAQLLAVEDDLIDDYVLGQLSERERKLFESHFLVTPQRWERLEISKALMGSISQSPASAVPLVTSKEPTSWWESILGLLRKRNVVLQISLASLMLVVVVGSLWWLLNNRQPPEHPEAEKAAQGTQQKTPEPGPLLAQQNSTDAGSNANQQPEANQQETNRQSNLQIEKNSPSPKTRNNNVVGRKDSPIIATFTLMPGAIRDSAESNIVMIRPGATFVRLKIFLGESVYKTYEAALQTASGIEVWRGTGLHARSAGTTPLILLTVPVDKLTQNSYTLILYGLKPDGDKEEVNYYQFKVTAK